jgi:Carboxypeptidase regulatory-like domain
LRLRTSLGVVPLLLTLALVPRALRAQDTVETITVTSTSMRGVVRDIYGRAVADAELLLPQWRRLVRSREDGSFRFQWMPEGRVLLHVRRLGFQPQLLHIETKPGTELTLTIELALMPVDSLSLARLGNGARMRWNLAAFYNRMQTGGVGRFYTGEELEKRESDDIGDLLRPALQIGRDRVTPCWNLYFDGHPSRLFVQSLSRPTDDIDALEIYDDGQKAPEHYRDRRCGVVLVWHEQAQSRRP